MSTKRNNWIFPTEKLPRNSKPVLAMTNYFDDSNYEPVLFCWMPKDKYGHISNAQGRTDLMTEKEVMAMIEKWRYLDS